MRGSNSQLVYFDEHRRDVVLAAALVRELDEALDADRPSHGNDGRDVIVSQISVQTVAAEEKAKAGSERDTSRVDLDVLAVADGTRDDVAMRRTRCFLRSDEPLLQLPRDERMVLGQLFDVIAVDAINAAIADLRGDGVVAEDEQRANRGAHPALVTIDLGD